ncbi:MAG: hypothetical protein ACRD1S_19405, partial [Vicinamibacterales bacterium]
MVEESIEIIEGDAAHALREAGGLLKVGTIDCRDLDAGYRGGGAGVRVTDVPAAEDADGNGHLSHNPGSRIKELVGPT